MQNDKTGACECVYYIFYRFCVCVHAKRAACSVDRLLSRLCIWAGLNPIFVSRKAHIHAHIHTHQCGWSFPWFYRLIFFCSIFTPLYIPTISHLRIQVTMVNVCCIIVMSGLFSSIFLLKCEYWSNHYCQWSIDDHVSLIHTFIATAVMRIVSLRQWL